MAWNEPGGEKRNPWNRPQQSQNDLDDVLRNLQRRLAALFGRGGAEAGRSSPSFARGLATRDRADRRRLDRERRLSRRCAGARGRAALRPVRAARWGPGYNWHLPWPIERKIIVNVSQQYSVPDDARMLTADTNLVEVRSAVQYTQPEPRKYLFKVKGVEETLMQVSESALREAVGQASLDQALAFDPSITDHARGAAAANAR